VRCWSPWRRGRINQVWFILAGAQSSRRGRAVRGTFSGLYLAMFVLLVAFILRPVGFAFRNKVADRAGAMYGTGS
jgi:cytochrome d ubiquinol oxidase subunit II